MGEQSTFLDTENKSVLQLLISHKYNQSTLHDDDIDDTFRGGLAGPTGE